MHRIDGAGHVGHMFVAEDPDTLRPPTEITPEIMNAFQEELATFIEWAGIVLAKGDNTQLKQALVAKFAGLDAAATKAGVQGQTYTAFTTTGATGAFVLTPNPAIAAYAAGQRFRVKFHAAGNGADTVAVSGLAAKNIKQYDSTGAKVAAVIAANQLVDVEYDGVDMVLLDPLPPTVQVQSATQGAFTNLKLSAGGTAASIAVSYDELVLGDGAGNYVTERNVAGTITTTNAGAGGLDTGALAASSWYSIWRIGKADGTRAWLFSLSATAPTMPAGYTFKARIGWFRTDGTANKYPLSFIQNGRRVQYKVAAGSNLAALPQMANGVQGSISTPTFVSVATGNFVPPTASEIVVSGVTLTSGDVVMIAPSSSYGAAGSLTNPVPLLVNTMTASSVGLIGGVAIALESANIYVAQSTANCRTTCTGWVDNI